ncbi:hypothetical protein PGB34_23030 [Xenophilus arseniciresistens]|uniref:Uncharacterized protein n=1 Tax=Xenophilus arseniciresistens TaxID=1283306 RepID=A0AAE3NDW0_9BURK|nr:hypothetical protein [Xenophilus arseniciresistens]MDA7419259.1 hypothetical protein [Xenophilus arseniciresistens]
MRLSAGSIRRGFQTQKLRGGHDHWEIKMEKMFKHLFAGAMGLLFDENLAKDYWWGENFPLHYLGKVEFRLLKIIYIYIAAATFQCVLPCAFLVFVIEILKNIGSAAFPFSLYVWKLIGFIFLFVYFSSFVIAICKYFSISKKLENPP